MRDDFSEEVKRTIANRVNNRCSKPDCSIPTSGPQLDPAKSLNIGVAAHITAASIGGPRYDGSLSPPQRKHPTNGIWLCQNHAKLVDNDEECFPERLLRRWKESAETSARALLGKAATSVDARLSNLSPEEMEILCAAADEGEIYLHSSGECADWVAVGPRDFADQTDPAYAAGYTDALESLQARRLVKYDEASLYVLTGTGFKLARALKTTSSESSSEHAKL
jgi:hypothetical protein